MKLKYISCVFLMFNGLPVSLNSTFEHGAAHMQGRRDTMEDAYMSIDPLADGQTSLFALFDGHGDDGAYIAHYAAQNIQQAIEHNTAFPHDLTTALYNAFDDLDQCLSTYDSGSTAVVTLIQDNHLYNAHVGDSRAVLSHNGQAIVLTQDHKPDRPDERARIESAGGFIMTWDVPRVCGQLAVSRAFGDLALRPFVIATPEIARVALTPHDEFLLLACDGVFEKNMTDQQAIDFIRDSLARHSNDPQAAQIAAQELIQEAYNRGSDDNISALVILLNQNQNKAQTELFTQAVVALDTSESTHEQHHQAGEPMSTHRVMHIQKILRSSNIKVLQ